MRYLPALCSAAVLLHGAFALAEEPANPETTTPKAKAEPAVSGRRLIQSQLDLSSSDARQKYFIPWSSPAEASEYWQRLAKDHVPIYKEFKPGDLSRDIYVPNPGIGYWVLGGLTEATFWQVEAEKEKIGDVLISASLTSAPDGTPNVWALWAPKKRAYLLLLKMMELGISQARIEDVPSAESASPTPAPDVGTRPLLPDGKYLLISYSKDDATVQRCAIMNTEDGPFIGFAAPDNFPEMGVKPLRVYVDADHFQFSIGPANYDPRVWHNVAPGTVTYVGKSSAGQLVGVQTNAGWTSESRNFVLYKD